MQILCESQSPTTSGEASVFWFLQMCCKQNTIPLTLRIWNLPTTLFPFLNTVFTYSHLSTNESARSISSYFMNEVLSQDSSPPRLVFSVIGMCAQSYRITIHAYSFFLLCSITYLKSSLSSFLDASKGTFRTRSLELFCFFVEAVFRCATMSLKRNIDGPRRNYITGWLVYLWTLNWQLFFTPRSLFKWTVVYVLYLWLY